MAKETITHEKHNQEAWVCICGNTPTTAGFLPCDEKGNQVEPVDGLWTNLYVCDRCGRIIQQDTLEVVGQKRSAPSSV